MDIINPEKYYKQVQERFPNLTMDQIKKIVNYGLRAYCGLNMAGGDVLLKSNYYSAYSGRLFFNDEIFWKYSQIKKKIKARLKYKRFIKKYSGVYYFGMTKRFYEEVYKPILPNGRKRKCWTPKQLTLYKSYEECLSHNFDYIFEIPRRSDVGFTEFIQGEKLRKYRLIAKRDKDGKIKSVDAESKLRPVKRKWWLKKEPKWKSKRV